MSALVPDVVPNSDVQYNPLLKLTPVPTRRIGWNPIGRHMGNGWAPWVYRTTWWRTFGLPLDPLSWVLR